MKEKSITVTAAKMNASGITNGKPWKIFQIIDQDKIKFSTFEEQLAQLGIPARVWYDEEQKTAKDKKTGKDFTFIQRTIRKFEVGAEYASKTVNIEDDTREGINMVGTKSQPTDNPSSNRQLEARVEDLVGRVTYLEGLVLGKEIQESGDVIKEEDTF